jgi:hypothetical protein
MIGLRGRHPFLSSAFRFLASIIDAEDWRIIAVSIIVILVVGFLLILLAGAAGIAVAVFEEVRSM